MLGLPADQHNGAIAAACGADEALALRDRALLEHDARKGTFLDEPALGNGFAIAGPTQSDDLTGSGVNGFRIESRIASGGMGTVFAAVRDGEFRKPWRSRSSNAEWTPTESSVDSGPNADVGNAQPSEHRGPDRRGGAARRTPVSRDGVR